MATKPDHVKAVAAWLHSCACPDDSEKLADLFCLAFNAIWLRAKRTLGDVTLTAIGDRVLHYARERHAALNSFVLEHDGIHKAASSTRLAELPTPEVAGALSYTLTELLTVVGNLTAEILTPALHAELSAIVNTNKEGTL